MLKREGPRMGPLLAGVVVVTCPRDATAQREPAPEPEPQAVGTASASPTPAPDQSSAPRGTGSTFELSGKLAYASPPIRGGTNPFGAGFGARAGLVFSGFYVGATITSFLGGKDVDVSYRSLLYGIETGFGFRLPLVGATALTLRPQFGLGDAAIYYTDPSLVDVVTSASGVASSDTITVHNVYLQPAMTVLLSSGWLLVALNANVLVLPNIAYGGADPTTWISCGLDMDLGVQF